ncbi:carbonic anhydrase [Trichoderma barbatum]
MTTFLHETLLERNKKYAKTHDPASTIAEQKALGRVFETTLVNQILISRNPAGRVTPALQEVMLFDVLLGLKSVIVIHHTDCGASHFKDADIREIHKSRLPDHSEIDNMVFGAFDNVEQSVRDDLHTLKTSPYVPKRIADHSVGFVYDIKSGLLTPVDYNDDV